MDNKVSVRVLANEFVDLDTSDVDSSPDIGTLTNFTEVKQPPTGSYAWFNETEIVIADENDYVDVNTSNVDGVAGYGSHSNFDSMKSVDGMDTLTEEDTGTTPSNNTVFIDGFEDQTFNKWNDNGATSWQIGTTGSGTGGSADPYEGTYDAWCDETNDGVLTSDDIDLSGATEGYVSFWYRKDDTEPSDFTLYYYDGSTYDLIYELDSGGSDDTWLEYNVS